MGFSTTFTSAPTYIAADPKSPKEILNVAGGTIYYKITDDVDAEDTAVTKGSSAQITAGSYFISASKSEVVVRELTVTNAEDINAVDDLTVGDDLTVSGKATVAESLEVGTTLVVKEGLTAKKAATIEEGLTVKKAATIEEGLTVKKTAVVEEKLTAKGEVEIDGDLNHDGTKAGFFGTAPDTRSDKITKAEAGGDAGLAKTVTRVAEIEAILVKLGLIKEAS